MNGTRIVMVALVILAPAAAHADRTVVVESYVGGRPAHVDRILRPLYSELDQDGYLLGAQLARAVEAKLSRPGEPMSPGELAATVELVEVGYRHWLAGEFTLAVEKLARGLDRLRRSPASIAADQALRDVVLKALVGLALANKRLGQTEQATQYMADVLRSFPDRDFNRTLFGPEAHDLYRAVKGELDKQGKGHLRVEVDDDSAVVFVNERFEAVGGGGRDLIPGRYRIYVQKGTAPGRVQDVQVIAGEEQVVKISWPLVAALVTGPAFVGLSYDSHEARQQLEHRYAAALARLVGATRIVLVSLGPYEGRRAIVASTSALDTPRPFRVGVIALEPAEPTAEQVRSLARFLAGGAPEPGVIVPPAVEEVVVTSHDGASEATNFGAWKWIAVGTGVAAMAGGAMLMALDGNLDSEGNQRPTDYHTFAPGVATASAGTLLMATGIVLLVAEKDGTRSRSGVAIVPIRGGSLLSFEKTF